MPCCLGCRSLMKVSCHDIESRSKDNYWLCSKRNERLGSAEYMNMVPVYHGQCDEETRW